MADKTASAERAPLTCIGVLTSGGDGPGMNAAVRAVVRTACANGLSCYGIQDGYRGMIDDVIEPMDLASVGGIINRGGTILGTARCKEFRTLEGQKKAAGNLRKRAIQGIVVCGGDGSYRGAHDLAKLGIQTVGIPGTIDNDIAGTDITIGFDTAVNTALEAIDKIRDTATSHHRLFVIEVMGRDAGFIAIAVGIGGGAEEILVPSQPFDYGEICQRLKAGNRRGKKSSIIVVAEGAARAVDVAMEVSKRLPQLSIRETVIGHLQRGGSPTAKDRVAASRLGYGAVMALLDGETDIMVGITAGNLVRRPLEIVWTRRKVVDAELYRISQVLAS